MTPQAKEGEGVYSHGPAGYAAGSTDQRNTLILVQRWSVVMKQRRRIYYSAAQRSEIWDRWQAGEPMSAIGRRFDRESSSVFSVISPTGGIRPPDRPPFQADAKSF